MRSSRCLINSTPDCAGCPVDGAVRPFQAGTGQLILRTRALIHSAVILVSIGAFASVLLEAIALKLAPSVDCLDTEPPIAAELDPRQVAPFEEPVDGGGMDPQIIG